MKFKLYFPTGYKNLNIHNDNIDVNIITAENSVYFATFFTIDSIVSIMEKNNEIWFWATDMIIIKDLDVLTIIKAVEELINNGNLESTASKIGSVESVFGESEFYSTLKDWRKESPQIVSGI